MAVAAPRWRLGCFATPASPFVRPRRTYETQRSPLRGAPPPALSAVLRRREGIRTGGRRLPPSPPKLPLIRNLHQLGSCSHRSLAALAGEHGPLMLLQLGQIPTLVVSSADMAEQILKTHDPMFANRPQLEIGKQLLYGCKDLALSSYGDYWRNLRKIYSVHLLSSRRVQTYKLAREEEVAFMIEKIKQLTSVSGAVDLSEILKEFVLDLLLRIIDGRSLRDESQNKLFHEVVAEQIALFSEFNLGDYYPSLRWLNKFFGLDSRVQRTFRKWENVLNDVIENHLNRHKEVDGLYREDFVDILLALQKDPSTNSYLATDSIKASIIDVLVAGTDTSYITLEWALVEVLRNSEVMKKAQAEVRAIAGAKPAVDEDNAAQMSYLRAVIKETLRMHPPATLLLPHLSSEDTQIDGYEVPKQTTVLINVWAIMRDPAYWDAPEEFRPERFMGSSLDFRGKDLQFIPFGSGRRICPGLHFAVSIVELTLANLLHQFDWGLPDGLRGEDLDMTETFGLATHRKLRLHLVPIPRAL